MCLCVCVCDGSKSIHDQVVIIQPVPGNIFPALTLSQRAVGGGNDNHGWICEITAVCLHVPESLSVHFSMSGACF